MAGDPDDQTAAEVTLPRSRKRTTQPPPDRYRIVELIGEGGMGRVYRAHDTALGRDVALKLIEGGDLQLPDRTAQRERFVREARAAARVIHPNIAVVHDVDPEAGWLVMELVEGESLRERADRERPSLDLVMRIASQVLSALDAAHSNGVIHRDIKPSNIMLTPGDRVKLVDFGVARIVDVEMTLTTDKVGTPAYMAPEQMRGGPVDERTDLYSLAAMLYELVTGKRVSSFESLSPEAVAELETVCAKHPALAKLIVRCLQADPAARIRSANDAFELIVGEAPRHKVFHGPAIWVAAAIAAIAIGTFAGFAVGNREQSGRDPRVEKAFALAQRGENAKALEILEDYLATHPNDPDANTIAFLAKWWQGSRLEQDKAKLVQLKLSQQQRALVTAIELITQKRLPEAIAYLESADRETPSSVEILFALGEARWHGGQLERGVATLERAIALDARWEMALHHVFEYRLSRGEAAQLQPISELLRKADPGQAAALDCKIAISERDYPRAVAVAKNALDDPKLEKIAELYLCLSQAQALTGAVDDGMATAKTAFDLWPLEANDKGGFSQYAEFFLYKNDLDGYLAQTRGRRSSQRAIAILLRRPDLPVDEPKPEWPKSRMAPLGAATWILQQHVHAADASTMYTMAAEPEIRAWGLALDAETNGDHATAIRHLREALSVPAKGDIRMLVAHRLAKLLHQSGDNPGAAAACDEVIRPRFYLNYRAVLLPDCQTWTAAK